MASFYWERAGGGEGLLERTKVWTNNEPMPGWPMKIDRKWMHGWFWPFNSAFKCWSADKFILVFVLSLCYQRALWMIADRDWDRNKKDREKCCSLRPLAELSIFQRTQLCSTDIRQCLFIFVVRLWWVWPPHAALHLISQNVLKRFVL